MLKLIDIPLENKDAPYILHKQYSWRIISWWHEEPEDKQTGKGIVLACPEYSFSTP